MTNAISTFADFVFEGKEADFAEFAQKRHDGAAKIAANAKEKGGTAMLTWHHFIVKLPYYKQAAAGDFDATSAKRELGARTKELHRLLKSFEPKDQTPFQRVMGEIEVLGELLIAHTKFANKK